MKINLIFHIKWDNQNYFCLLNSRIMREIFIIFLKVSYHTEITWTGDLSRGYSCLSPGESWALADRDPAQELTSIDNGWIDEITMSLNNLRKPKR